MAEVLVVGSYVQDLAFQTKVFPAPGETRIGIFHPGPGGKGFNQAIACHRQGVATQFVGAVGKDLFAKGLMEYVATESIQVSLLEVSHQSTGAASIVVEAGGQNQIVVALGANDFLTPNFVEQSFGKPKIILAQVESNLEAAHQALLLGRKSGALNILNPAPINPGVSHELLSLADLLTPNETEFSFLLSHVFDKHLKGEETEKELFSQSDQQLHQLCRLFEIPMVVLTLGSLGCFVSSQEEYYRVPAISVNVKDSTGAGDAFSGGLAAGMIKFQSDLHKAVQYATVVAGLSTEKLGTAPAMPTLQTVEKRFAQEFN